jgi:hypothetical protein
MRFTGWYRDMALTKLWNFDTDVVTGTMRLYAGYDEVPPPRVKSIEVDGVLIPGFSPDVYKYTLTYDTVKVASPIVTATPEEAAFDVTITYPAAGVPGQAIVKVSDEDIYSIYTITFEVLPPKLTSISFGGDVFNVADKSELDINVPDTVSNIAFSTSNVACAYPGDVDISVVLSPETGKVSAGAPCVATVSIAWKGIPGLSAVYKVNFGYQTIGDISVKSGSGGYNVGADVRFSNGETGYTLIYAVYRDNKLVSFSENRTPAAAIPKHQSGIVNGVFPIPGDKECTVKVFLWDQHFIPLVECFDGGVPVETEVWKVAKTIEPGKQYVIVSARAGGGALTNSSATVPPGDGFTVERAGRGRTAVTIEGDYIASPMPANTPVNIIWDFSIATATHNDPGPFTGQTRFAIRNGTGTSNYLQRQSSSSTNSAILTTAATPGTGNMGIWFFKTPDATGITSACLYSNNDSSNHWVFALLGNGSGFIAEGGNIATGGDPTPYQNAAPLRLYEKVIELRPPH